MHGTAHTPKNTPPAVVSRLQQREIAKVLATPAISSRLIQDGLDPAGSTPEKFREFLLAERKKLASASKCDSSSRWCA
nr:tripartite tricarboxylate transporter substrate-binding protein [Ramlibacter sp. WS9]